MSLAATPPDPAFKAYDAETANDAVPCKLPVNELIVVEPDIVVLSTITDNDLAPLVFVNVADPILPAY